MSYQILCDNCGATERVDTRSSYPKPANWESVPLSAKQDGITKHHCPECIAVKERARLDKLTQIQNAEEEALAARRVRTISIP